MSTETKEKQMWNLWKNTFHDSDEYINLVFDNYYDPELTETYEENGKIVSCLMGVPYRFVNGDDSFNALYLCGLATDKEFRRKGYMGELLRNAEKRFKDHFDMLFLIPSSESLLAYYDNHGYHKGIYRTEERYTAAHDFRNDFVMSLQKVDERIRDMKIELLDRLEIKKISFPDIEAKEQLKDYIRSKEEGKKNYAMLCHSEKDIEAVIKENEISGGDIYICKDKDDNITGVSFSNIIDKERIQILQIYHDNPASYYKLLHHIKFTFPDNPITVWQPLSDGHKTALREEYFGTENPDGGDLDPEFGDALRPFDPWLNAKVYGVVNILNYGSILRYIAKNNPKRQFTIFIKDSIESNSGLFCSNYKGKVEISEFEDFHILLQKYPNLTVLTKKETTELLFRKKGESSIITDIFGISPLHLYMSLLLD